MQRAFRILLDRPLVEADLLAEETGSEDVEPIAYDPEIPALVDPEPAQDDSHKPEDVPLSRDDAAVAQLLEVLPMQGAERAVKLLESCGWSVERSVHRFCGDEPARHGHEPRGPRVSTVDDFFFSHQRSRAVYPKCADPEAGKKMRHWRDRRIVDKAARGVAPHTPSHIGMQEYAMPLEPRNSRYATRRCPSSRRAGYISPAPGLAASASPGSADCSRRSPSGAGSSSSGGSTSTCTSTPTPDLSKKPPDASTPCKAPTAVTTAELSSKARGKQRMV